MGPSNSNESRTSGLQKSYDRVAIDYARHIYHELEGKPLDREILNRFAALPRGQGIVCDMGCGPGHIARFLAGQGVDMIGVDISPGMLTQARILNPDIPFHHGDMLALDEKDGTWAGIVAFYSIIHIPREQVLTALGEFWRVLMPGGWLLLAFHLGDQEIHETELWEHEISLDYWFFESEEMTGYLEQAGFRVAEVIEREPYAPEVEYQSRRAYVLAQKPDRQEV
jgi:SAM-dependent methyltransferase